MKTDARLVIERCVAGGDEAAWEEFIHRFDDALRRGVRAALGGRPWRADGLEEDLLQEVYCRLLDRDGKRLSRCRERNEVAIRAYLARLARNAAIDQLRSRGTIKRGRHHLLASSGVGAVIERARDRGSSIEERLIVRQQGRRFLRRCRRAAAGRSAERNFRILALAFLAGLTSREISQRLDSALSPGSIDSLISRARKKLAAEGVDLATRRRSPAPRPPSSGSGE